MDIDQTHRFPVGGRGHLGWYGCDRLACPEDDEGHPGGESHRGALLAGLATLEGLLESPLTDGCRQTAGRLSTNIGPVDPWRIAAVLANHPAMAEIALGGIQVTVGPRPSDRDCLHPTTLTTTTAGLERIVCESCGHLSVRYLRGLTHPVDRRQFARPADRFQRDQPTDHARDMVVADLTYYEIPDPVGEDDKFAAAVFALQERLHIRRRYEAHPQNSMAVA